MAWNYLQVEVTEHALHPTVGPGDLTRDEAHAYVRRLLVLYSETAPHPLDDLIAAWDAGAADDTAYVGSLLWAIYEDEDAARGARAWVDDLAATLRRTGSKKVRVSW